MAEKISSNITENVEKLTQILGNPADIRIESPMAGSTYTIAFFNSLVGEKIYQVNQILRNIGTTITPNSITQSLIGMNPQITDDFEIVVTDLSKGSVIIFISGFSKAVSFNTFGWAKHEPKEPSGEKTIRGPREGFTETLDENIGMVRRWIADYHLRVDQLQIGRRTKTKVAVIYLSDIAQPKLIQEVHRRLSAIDIDGVLESGYLEQLIKDRRSSIFPLTQATERTDKATAGILEGRVAILVDKSPFAILVPVTANELYQSSDDYYSNFWLAGLTRLLRLFGNILAVGLPGLYVAFAAANPDLLPTQLTLIIASSRAHSPIPLAVEVFLLEIMVGIFFEAGIRLPGKLSQTVGIPFGVIIGLAGILSGIVSPVTMIIVAITTVASYTSPNFNVGTVWRFLKYIMLLAASLYGFFGLSIAGVLILGHMADLKSFGVSYLAPWAPMQWPELTDAPVRMPFWARWTRPKTYRPQDQLRSGDTKRKDDEND